MKYSIRHSVADFIGRAGGAFAAVALFLGQPAAMFAEGADDRKHSENAVKHIKHIIVIY